MTTLNPFDVSTKAAGTPVSIVRGFYLKWWRDFSFSATSLGLKYVFRKGTDEFTITGSNTDGKWVFEALSAVSSTWVAGRYAFDVVLVRLLDGEEAVLESGFIDVVDPEADRRSKAQIMVDKIDSILSGRADSDVDQYTIAGRSITKMTTKDLMEWRAHYIAEVKREENGGRIPTLKVRFTG